MHANNQDLIILPLLLCRMRRPLFWSSPTTRSRTPAPHSRHGVSSLFPYRRFRHYPVTVIRMIRISAGFALFHGFAPSAPRNRQDFRSKAVLVPGLRGRTSRPSGSTGTPAACRTIRHGDLVSLTSNKASAAHKTVIIRMSLPSFLASWGNGMGSGIGSLCPDTNNLCVLIP